MEKKYYLVSGIIILVIAAVLAIPNKKIPENEPGWVKDLIASEINSPASNPPASLSKCIYREDAVYYLPPRCCDVPGVLYDREGNIICSPDGGFSGSGDGRCPDFSNERKSCEVIWQDSRPYP